MQAQQTDPVAIAKALCLTIAHAGNRGVTSGHAYAALMGQLNLDQYNGILSVLKDAGLITERHFLLLPTEKLLANYTATQAVQQ